MYVDREGPYSVIGQDAYEGLDLSEPLYLGGVPNFNEIAPDVNANRGFVGEYK